MRFARLLGLALFLLVAGCATMGGPTPQELAQARQAKALAAQGQFAEAAQAYDNLAAQSSSSDYFRLRAAEAWRDGGQLDHAARELGNVSRRALSSTDRDRYDLLSAEIDLSHGATAAALALAPAATGHWPQALQLRADELRARALASSGQAFAAARTRVRMDPLLEGLDQADNRRQIVTLLNGMGAQALQQQASTLAPDDPMRRWVNEVLARLGVAVARPSPQLDHPVGTLLPGSRVQQGYQAPSSVALLLPARGQLATAAGVIREGLFTAYFNRNGDGGAAPPSVRSYDTGTTPGAAVAAYQQAVSDGASLVIGPLARDAVAALLQLPQLPVPVLALNHPDQEGLSPANVTEFGLQPETEGVEVANHMHERGITQALVFVTTEDFAQRAGRAFATQFTADGGTVLRTIALDPTAVDFSEQLKDIDPDKLAQDGHAGVFISMRPYSARLLLPQLHLAKINVPVFATSHIYAGIKDPDDDGDLDGVEFCDAPWLFDAQPGLPAREDLARSLPAVRTGSGARLFALGMDAWALAPYLDWLRGHPGSYLSGATGQLSEDDFGRIHRTLIWARFKNGIAHPVAGSLEASSPSAGMPAAPAAKAAATGADNHAQGAGH